MTIQEIRKRTGLSQNKFAAIYGIPPATLKQWERNGAKPANYLLVMMEKALKYDGYIKERI